MLRRYYRRLLIFMHDACMIAVAWFSAYGLHYYLATISGVSFSQAGKLFPVIFACQCVTFYSLGLYRSLWRFVSLSDLARLIKAVVIGTLLSVALLFFSKSLVNMPRLIFPMFSFLAVACLGGSRLGYRWLRESRYWPQVGKNVLIVGAGQAGEGVVRDMLRNVKQALRPVALVDDKPNKQGQEIHGIRVVGKSSDIPQLVKKYNIDVIVIAIPSARSVNMRHIVSYCGKTGVPFRTLPSLQDLALGRVNADDVREVSLEDLLGRDQVELAWDAIHQQIENRVVLITGGGGSIGMALSMQVAKLNPKRLIIFDNSEYNLYYVEICLKRDFPQLQVSVCLADITDAGEVASVMQRYHPNVVFHAAAYKHVPMLESQLRVAINNNVLGTRIVSEQAARHGVEKFVFISTDKAVNPTNIMGASKRAAEIFCQNLNAQVETQFITVRFGNVLGSTGSVVPLFKEQIKKGGPVTVTHPEVTRYFMTLSEAAQLILQATVMGCGGEIFVLDMGDPIKIKSLADHMIRLSGKKPYDDIDIIYSGLRPGEKLHEELFHEREHLLGTGHEKILKAHHRQVDWRQLVGILGEMTDASRVFDRQKLLALLIALVPEYSGVLREVPSQQSTLEGVEV